MYKNFPAVLFFAISFALFLSACSNSEYVNEFGVPVSDYAFDDKSQDSAYIKNTFTDFPPSGFYPKPFTIFIPGNKLLNCETGGIAPTKNSSAQKEISIDSTTVIRCIDNSADTTTEIVRTYIFEKKPTIPAIFIATDPNSLFNPDTGIYVDGPNAEEKMPHKGANYWLDKEIPIFIEFTEAEAYIPAFTEYAGLKIFGNYSRVNPKKSVSINFREKYGKKRLNYMLFPEFPSLNQFKSFVLRNFGNIFERDYIRDRLASSISEGLNVDYQRGRYVIVYYNGQYFGLHDMRERSNEYYFETHYGLKHKNINLLKANNNASAGSSDDYISLMNWLKSNNLDNEINYNYISSKIDINNFINYMQIEIFAYNHDWPGNNEKKWNCTNPQTLWKWFIYDVDAGFEEEYVASNMFYFLSSQGETNYANAPHHTLLFRSLLQNENFKNSFINRMTTLLQMNLKSSRILAQIEKLMSDIEKEIPRDQMRWSRSPTKMDKQLQIIKQFAINRPSHLIQHLQEFFKLGSPVPITLSTNKKGTIQVHGLPLDEDSLTITFFTGLPVTITAIPQKGCSWSHWSDGETKATRIIYPNKNTKLVAIFE